MTGIESQKIYTGRIIGGGGWGEFIYQWKQAKNTTNDKECIPHKFLVLIYRRKKIDMIKD